MIGPPLVLVPLVLPLITGWALMLARTQWIPSRIEEENGGGELVQE